MTTYPHIQGAEMPPPPPPPPVKRRRRWPWVVGGVVVLLLAISAASAGMSGTNDNPTVRDRGIDTTEAPVTDNEETTTTTEVKDELTPERFTPALTVKSKQCFGSAGCNVTFQIDLTYVGDTSDLEGRTFDVTYQVDGGDSGPIIGTISASGQNYDVQENFASTSSSEAQLTVKVTGVEEYEF